MSKYILYADIFSANRQPVFSSDRPYSGRALYSRLHGSPAMAGVIGGK